MPNKLGVICSQFPEMHETFVIRELKAIQDSGLQLEIYSLKACRDKITHPESKTLIPITHYLPWDSPSTLKKILVEICSHPLKSLLSFGWTIQHHSCPISNLIKSLGAWGLGLAAALEMRKDGITHIHSHWANAPTTAAVVCAKQLGIPFTFTAHAFDIFVQNTSLKEKIRLSKGVITCTDYNRKYLNHIAPDCVSKIFLNYHGVNLHKFNQEAMQSSQKTNPVNWGIGEPGNKHIPLFLSVGRMVETKGYPVLLDAYKKLKDRNISFRALIIGTGELQNSLEIQIKNLGLTDRVELKNSMSQSDLLKLYKEAFAFVLPCIVAGNQDRDGIPNVILEAMALAMPIVTTNISGIPEAIQDQRSGLLVRPHDPELLAQSLDLLLRNPSFAETLGKRARIRAEELFSAELHMAKLTELMNKLIHPGPPNDSISTTDSSMPLLYEAIKPTVAHVIWSLEIGGAEKAVQLITTSLDKNLFRPIVICLNHEGRLAENLKNSGIKVIALHKKPNFDFGLISKLVKVLKDEKVKIIHSHLFGASAWARVAAFIAGVPIRIVHEHGMQPWRTPKHFMIDRLLSRWTHKILFVSEEVLKTYRDKTGVIEGKCQLVKNGVLCPEIPESKASLRKSLGLNEEAQILLSVGRLSPEKGHEDLVKAFIAIYKSFPNTVLVIVGDGPEKTVLNRLKEEYQLGGRLILPGSQDIVTPWLLSADIYIQPSRREGLSFSILEAMASSLPVIATRVGDVEKVITHGKEGFLVEAGNTQALSKQISDVLLNLHHLNDLKLAARQVILSRYSNAVMMSAIESIYLHELTVRS